MKPAISREAFLQFCESKPADEVFEYTDRENCAVAQYAKSLGLKSFGNSGADGVSLYDLDLFTLFSNARTFGALARRLREGV